MACTGQCLVDGVPVSLKTWGGGPGTLCEPRLCHLLVYSRAPLKDLHLCVQGRNPWKEGTSSECIDGLG